MEQKLARIAPWIPLLIAAGYFLFLITTWQVMMTNMKAADARFDAMLDKFKANAETPEVKDE